MPSSGSGVGTPIGGGGALGSIKVQPLPVTWLSLHRYAKYVDINPVHFWGATGQDVWNFGGNSCNDIWPGYSWQYGSQISRAELAVAIKDAEDSIADFVGYPLAPTFVSEEHHNYPAYHNKDLISWGGRRDDGLNKSVSAKWKKVIAPGRRAVTLIEAEAPVVYSDEDGDGFSETATITVTTTVTPCEVKAYFAGTGAEPGWEIREANGKTASVGTVILRFDSWLFINPNLQAVAPNQDGYSAIDITTTSNYVAEVDIYREYADPNAVGSQFSWSCGAHCVANCSVCGSATQDGCLILRNHETGAVVPAPATYTEGWSSESWSLNRSPEYVKIWYMAGDRSENYLSGRSCDPLSDFWATQIVRLATARLYKPFCQCGNVTAFAKDMQVDLTRQGTEGSHLLDFTKIVNHFGSRRGEYMVYQALSQGSGRRRKIIGGAVR